MRRIFYSFLSLSLLLLFTVTSHAQQRNCSTMEVLDRLLEEDPQMQIRMEQMERFTQNYLKQGIDFRADVIKIPVVVHIVYENDLENLSDAQVQSQIDVLNEDFRRTNADADNTWPQAADTQIEFCLATIDPSGNSTSGITRTSTSVTSFGTNDEIKFNSSGGKDAWPAGDYLNMWVGDISSGILGYAQFPGGDPATDGVVIDYLYFGRGGSAQAPFDLGRTGTHEVGHWLNLRHIWGDGPCRFDDQVTDTPDSDNPNYGCNEGHVSCRSTDMVQNYMDYSDDACMNIFTSGQSGRMNALFAAGGLRESLLSSPAACGGSSPPPAAEICDDGIDNDGDGLIDCEDGDCGNDTACQPLAEVCDDGIDNDGDGLIDCEDGDCGNDTACQPTGTCDAPGNLSTNINKGGKEAELNWNAVNSALNYTATITDLSSGQSSSTTVNGTTVLVSGLNKGSQYEWCVVANCSDATSPAACQTFTASPGNREAQWSTAALQIYPNPARDVVTIAYDNLAEEEAVLHLSNKTTIVDQRYFLYLVDLTGRVIQQFQIAPADNRMEISVAGLAHGLYLIKVTDAEGNLKRAGKVIVNY